jgi:hypothetical protein
MANQFSKVSVAISASTGGLSAGLNRAKSQLSNFAQFGNKLRTISVATSFLAIAKAGEILYRSIRGIYSALNNFTQAASNLVEEQNRVDIIFGQSADTVKKFAASSASIGLANTQALKAAGTFGTLFKNIGASEEQSSAMSIQLTKLSADMASFNNVTTDEALRAMRSALVGEVEPIRRMGVVLNDATLRLRAFNMGLTDTVSKTLTPAVKLQAAYAEILERTADQQGDATRTANTLAGQQRILTANLNNLKTTIGGAFMPIFQAIASGLNQLMPALQALATMFVESFTAGASSIMTNIGFVDILNGGIRLVAGGVTILVGLYRILKAGLFSVMAASSKTAAIMYDSLNSVSHVIAAIVTSLETNLRTALEYLTFPIQGLLQGLSEAMLFLGQDGLAGELNDIADRLATLSDRSSGLGQAIEDGLFGEMADIAAQNATAFGEQATEAFETGIGNITDPFARFDATMAAQMKAAGNSAAGPIGAAIGANARDALEASTKALKAITVDSAGGEAFRNAILRGADPRLAASNDQKIADNTGRMAEGIDALPDALATSIGGAMSAASISV